MKLKTVAEAIACVVIHMCIYMYIYSPKGSTSLQETTDNNALCLELQPERNGLRNAERNIYCQVACWCP